MIEWLDVFGQEYGWNKSDIVQLNLAEIEQLIQKINERRRNQNKR